MKNKIYKKPEYEKVTFKWKKALLMILFGLLAFVILKVFLYFWLNIIWLIYELIVGTAFIVYTVMVRGRFGKTPTKEELTDSMTDKEKEDFISEENERKKSARPCLYIALPFLIAIMIGIVTEVYLPSVFGI